MPAAARLLALPLLTPLIIKPIIHVINLIIGVIITTNNVAPSNKTKVATAEQMLYIRL